MKRISPLFGEVMYWAAVFGDARLGRYANNPKSLAVLRGHLEIAIAFYLNEEKVKHG